MHSLSNDEKLNIVNKYLSKLMLISENAINNTNYELALSALSAYCNIQYSINQVYTDKKAEDSLLKIGERTVSVPTDYIADNNVVLFYDGFGLDLRGWGASFARALSSLKYKYVYVASLHSKGKIPHIEQEVANGNGEILYVDMNHGYLRWIKQLNEIFVSRRPKAAFFYTTPNDVSGATVFDCYKDKLLRIQVDLTDHAFWIGVNAIDLLLEGRNVGAFNALVNRGINPQKIVKMDSCPYINRDIDQTPFPFDIEKEQFIFSGGSLYKTLGDKELLFYKIVECILSKNSDIKFIYAGEGDVSQLNKLKLIFPNRVFYIHERSDFIRLFEHCLFFLNTYPMFGGLMMRYASLCGKVPLTLKHGNDHEGLLIDQDTLGIEFDSFDALILEADKLISNADYRKKKELKLVNSVMREVDFAKNVHSLIENQKTDYCFENIEEIDTREFRCEYIERLNPYKMLTDVIPCYNNNTLVPYFPILFIRMLVRKFLRIFRK